MIYYTKSRDGEIKLEIITSPEGQTTVKLPDGEEWAADLDAVLGDNLFSLLVHGQSHEFYAQRDDLGEYTVILDGQVYTMEVETERQHRFASLANANKVDTGEISIKSPMPGLVTIVSVTAGETIELGQRLLVLEAMKMENEIRAPRAGVVKVVHVQRGQTVEQNKALLVIE